MAGDEVTCQAPAKELFGPRCGKPGVYKTRLYPYVCEECGQRLKADHEAGKTVLSVLVGGQFPLMPIH